MTAAPQNGEEEDLQLFMALLDGDRFEGRFGDRFYVTNVSDLMRRLWISLGMGYEHGNQHPTFVKVPTWPLPMRSLSEAVGFCLLDRRDIPARCRNDNRSAHDL